MDNFISVTGNLTRDPELRFTPSGVAKVTFGLACNRRWTDKEGNKQEAVSYFNCYAWRDLAENIGESLSKGDRVTVTGRLEQRSFEQSGEKRSVVEIDVQDVGASLRWATVKISRNERDDRATGPSEPRSGGSGSRGQGGASRRNPEPPPAAEPAGAWDDEEPF